MALNTNLLANIPQVRLDPAAFDTAGTMAKVLQLQQAQQQIQQGQRQSQLTQLQIDDLLADRKEMETFRAALVAKGGSPDLNAYADMLLRSPKHMQTGIELKQKLAEQSEFDKIYKQLYPEAAAPAAAPAVAPVEEPPVSEPPVATAFPVPSSPSAGAVLAPINALAPTSTTAGAAPQPAPANALAKTKTADDLRREIMLFSRSADPRAKAMVNVLQAQLQEAVRQTRPMVVGPNVYFPATNEFKSGPAAPAAPTTLAKLQTERAALPPGDPRIAQYDALILKETTHAPPARATVSLPPQEKAEQGKRGEFLVDQYKALSNAAGLASRTLPALETQERLLTEGFKTGFGTEAQKAGASVLAALGIPEASKFATDAQTFLSATQQAVLQRQLEQKGPQTEADSQRITQTGAQLGNTPEANKFMIAVAKAQLKRDIEQRNFYDKWWKTNKTYDGAEDAWFTGEGGKSLFDRPELKTFAAPIRTTPAATPQKASSLQEQADAILRGGKR